MQDKPIPNSQDTTLSGPRGANSHFFASNLSGPGDFFVYEQLLAGKTVLVLEDQVLIAMEAEHSLLQMGAKSVVLVSTVSEALGMIQDGVPDVAVLDINLGRSSTSFSVAEALHARGAPWVFATGYGDEINLPLSLRGAVVVRKPYTTEMLGKALQQTLGGVC